MLVIVNIIAGDIQGGHHMAEWCWEDTKSCDVHNLKPVEK